jgi:uncharacterized protein YjbI with pentapeptide repeats
LLEQREDTAVTNFLKEMQPLLLERGLRKSTPNAEVRSVAHALTLVTLSQLVSENAPQKKTLVIRFLLDAGLNYKPGNLFDLNNVDLQGADLSWIDLRGVALYKAKLNNANLYRANLTEGVLNSAQLKKVNLKDSGLRDVMLSEANLAGADLRGALLTSAVLSGADLRGADLRGAYLRDAILGPIVMGGPAIRVGEEHDFILNSGGSTVIAADLRGADLKDIIWDKDTKSPEKDNFKGAKNISPALKQQLSVDRLSAP